MSDDDLVEWIRRWRTGELSSEEFEDMQKKLLLDANLRSRFREETNFDAAGFEASGRDVLVEKEEPIKLVQKTQWWSYAAVAFLAIGVTVILSEWLNRSKIKPQETSVIVEKNEASHPSKEGVAVSDSQSEILKDQPENAISSEYDNLKAIESSKDNGFEKAGELKYTFGVEWGGENALQDGSGFEIGQYEIKSGALQLQLVSGSMVNIEAPAQWEIQSGDRLEILYGKFYFSILENQKGLEVVTDNVLYRDIGTVFGVEKLKDGSEVLDVFEGEVAMSDLNKDRLVKIQAPGGMRQAPNGLRTSSPLRQNYYMSVSDMGQKIIEKQALGLKTWQEASHDFQKIPGLLVYYDFEVPVGSNRLINRSTERHHATIVGCDLSQGRWPGKTALDFKQQRDHLKINLPGEFDEITMLTWVRIDRHDGWSNSLLLADLFEDAHIHWQVREKGWMDIGLMRPNNLIRVFLSPPVVDFESMGRWMQLGVTLCQEHRRIRFFKNGEMLNEHDIFRGGSKMKDPNEQPFKFRIGSADIGNFSPVEDALRQRRNLNGRLDEFMIFERELSPDEIQTIYQKSNPFDTPMK